MLGVAAPTNAPADRPPATDPISGEVGYWLASSDVARVAAQHTVITPIEYALLELARAYTRNARTEVMIDDVARMVNDAHLTDAAGLIENDRLLHRLTAVIRSLLGEGAPVLALQAIVDAVREARTMRQ